MATTPDDYYDEQVLNSSGPDDVEGYDDIWDEDDGDIDDGFWNDEYDDDYDSYDDGDDYDDDY